MRPSPDAAPVSQVGAPTRKRSARLVEILEAVADHGALSVPELASRLGVSAASVRRDLAALADQGLLLRTHGGAARLDRGEVPVALRGIRNAEAKRAIARAVVAMVPPERYAIALSGGTTTASVAREVAEYRPDLTIVTNSYPIAGLVTAFPHLKVLMTGGMLRPQSLELVGALAEGAFGSVNVGMAVLGADGVSVRSGVTTHDETEARTNRAMVASAGATVVVADGSKVGRVALAQMAGIEEVRLLVTDRSADPVELDRLRRAGLEVIVAD